MCGGKLELWDRSGKHHITIVSKFNHLVIMQTNPLLWHSANTVKLDQLYGFVSNYYFAPFSSMRQNNFNVTSFSGRSVQKALCALALSDNKLRQAVRWISLGGLGKKYMYEGLTK